MTLVVTGAAGFIGSNLVKAAAHHLVEQKFRVAIHVQRGFVFA